MSANMTAELEKWNTLRVILENCPLRSHFTNIYGKVNNKLQHGIDIIDRS